MMNHATRIIKASLFSMALPLSTVPAFSQAVVTDITDQLWSIQLQGLISSEREYPSFIWPIPMENLVEDELVDKLEARLGNFIVHHCAFHQVNPAQNTLWTYDVTPLYEGYH